MTPVLRIGTPIPLDTPSRYVPTQRHVGREVQNGRMNKTWCLTPCFPRFGPANSRLLPHGPLGLPRTAPCTRMTCRCVARERCSSRTRPRTCSWGPVRRHLEVRCERRSIGTLGTSRISCHTPWACDSDPSAERPRFSRGAHDRTSHRRQQTLALSPSPSHLYRLRRIRQEEWMRSTPQHRHYCGIFLKPSSPSRPELCTVTCRRRPRPSRVVAP